MLFHQYTLEHMNSLLHLRVPGGSSLSFQLIKPTCTTLISYITLYLQQNSSDGAGDQGNHGRGAEFSGSSRDGRQAGLGRLRRGRAARGDDGCQATGRKGARARRDNWRNDSRRRNSVLRRCRRVVGGLRRVGDSRGCGR